MWLITLISVAFFVYYVVKKKLDYWQNKGIPCQKPTFIVGNLGPNFILKKSLGQIFTEIYNEYPQYPVVGVYKCCSPMLLVRDPELIKDIMVKNFRSFCNNDVQVDRNVDPLLGRNPFFLKNQEWKDVRGQITPCFTTGKMKFLFPLVEDVSSQLVKYINKHCETTPKESLESKDICTKYTVGNVASCAFGFNSKSFEEKSEFLQLAKEFLNADTLTSIKFLVFLLFPFMCRFLKIKLVNGEVEDKLRNLVSETLKYRAENNIVRNDFLNIMENLRKNNKDVSSEDVAAHAASFIVDGFETSAVVMSFVLYELASHPDVQEKLREGIKTAEEHNNNKLTYESIMEMDYLNAVILESLRKNPAVAHLGKTCNEKFRYTTPDDSELNKISVTIEPGMSIIIPTGALSLDEKYFPKPEEYDPERFTGDNKNKHNKYVLMPFGEGPRQCLGQRFGLLQIKTGVAHVVKNFKMTLNKNKTKLPLEFDPVYILRLPKGGLWIDFEKIN